MEDQQILKLFLARAEGAIDALAETLGKRLHAIAMNILTDPQDAEECVNDTYLALWDAIPPATPDPLSAYAFRVCRNTALKRLRSRQARKRSGYEVSLDELTECIADSSAGAMDERELGRLIDRYLGTLSKENRGLFLRRYWFGDSIHELSRALGIRENALTVRLSRIRAGLKTYLSREGYYP